MRKKNEQNLNKLYDEIILFKREKNIQEFSFSGEKNLFFRWYQLYRFKKLEVIYFQKRWEFFLNLLIEKKLKLMNEKKNIETELFF